MEVILLILTVLGGLTLAGLGVRKLVTKGFDRDTLSRIGDELILAIDLLKGDTTLEERKNALKELGSRLEEKDVKVELDDLIDG